MATSSSITLRLLERRSNRPVQEIEDWRSIRALSKLRRVGYGRAIVPFSAVGSEAAALLASDNAAIWIRYEYEIDGATAGVSTLVTETYSGPISRIEVNTEQRLWTWDFNDNLLYLTERAVNTDGEDYIDPGSGSPISAIAHIRSLLNSELLAPTDGDRAIDIPAALATSPTGGGNSLELPVRWKMLDEAVEKACIAGDVGIKAVLNSSSVVEYTPFALNDRTAGSGGDIGPISQDITGSPLKVAFDWRAIKSRAYVLGQGELSSRTVREREVACTRLREMVVDARHIDTNDALDERGDVELGERRLPLRQVEVLNIERSYNLAVGDKITVGETVARDATGIDIGPSELVIEAREIRFSPGSIDSVKLFVGHEPDATASLIRGLAKRSEQAQFS